MGRGGMWEEVWVGDGRGVGGGVGGEGAGCGRRCGWGRGRGVGGGDKQFVFSNLIISRVTCTRIAIPPS